MSPFVMIAYAGIGISALILAGFAGAQIQKFSDQVKRMEERIAELETAKKTRNPYRTNEALEDAMAIIHDAAWQADATLDYMRARLKQVDNTLQVARSNPDDYDPDKPNKKRPL